MRAFKGARFKFDSNMPARDWVKIRNVNAGSTAGGPGLLSDPRYVVKSQMQWGFNPCDVKQGEEELIFKGERRVQLEIACDSFAAILRMAVHYLERCKRIGHGALRLQNANRESGVSISQIVADDEDDDISRSESMGGRSRPQMSSDSAM